MSSPSSPRDLNVWLETLRALLAQPPSAQTWQTLGKILHRQQDSEGLSIGIDYAQGHLARWPGELPTAHPIWLTSLIYGLPEPRFALARCLQDESGLRHFEELAALWTAAPMEFLSPKGYEEGVLRTFSEVFAQLYPYGGYLFRWHTLERPKKRNSRFFVQLIQQEMTQMFRLGSVPQLRIAPWQPWSDAIVRFFELWMFAPAIPRGIHEDLQHPWRTLLARKFSPHTQGALVTLETFCPGMGDEHYGFLFDPGKDKPLQYVHCTIWHD